MKIILLLLLTFNAYAARENTIDADCVRLKGGTCIDKNELGYSDGVTSAIQTQFTGKVSTTGNESISGVKTLTGQLIANSTANGFRPCPVMNETQRNAIASPVSGDCLYNSTTTTLNVYNGSAWKSAGGGINNWLTSTSYQVDDVVIQSNLIYKCLIAHTSGTFATDLAAVRWVRLSTDVSGASGTLPVANGGTNSTTALSGSSIAISNGSALVQGAAGTTTTLLHGNASGAPTYSAASLTTDVSGVLPLANGGTNKNMTAVNGGVVWTDADSQEVIAAGTNGQILRSNGAAAPTWVSSSLTDKTCVYAFGGTSATLASPTECTSGTCVEVYDSCSAISPPSWVATATYTNIVIANGTYANSVPLMCTCSAFDTNANQPRDCPFYFDTGDSTWSTNSSGGATLNIQSTNQDSAQTSYVIFTCVGTAP